MITVIIDEMGDMMAPSLSKQRQYGFVYTFYGGTQTLLMGQHSFFETNQSHAGGVLNRFQETGTNDHIMCVLCGRLTPEQKEIARSKSDFNTQDSLCWLNWLILTAKHYTYKDVMPPHDC